MFIRRNVLPVQELLVLGPLIGRACCMGGRDASGKFIQSCISYRITNFLWMPALMTFSAKNVPQITSSLSIRASTRRLVLIVLCREKIDSICLYFAGHSLAARKFFGISHSAFDHLLPCMTFIYVRRSHSLYVMHLFPPSPFSRLLFVLVFCAICPLVAEVF